MAATKRRQLPASFTAGRAVTLAGTTYAKGATVPNSVVAGLKRVSALISRRILVPNIHPHQVKGKLTRPTPTAFGTKEREYIRTH